MIGLIGLINDGVPSMFFKIKGDVEMTIYRVGVTVERRVAKEVPIHTFVC